MIENKIKNRISATILLSEVLEEFYKNKIIISDNDILLVDNIYIRENQIYFNSINGDVIYKDLDQILPIPFDAECCNVYIKKLNIDIENLYKKIHLLTQMMNSNNC